MEEYGQNRPTKAKPSGLLNLLVTSVQRGGDANDDTSRTGIGARSRPDEARRVVAHVFRIVAGAAPREALEAGSTKGVNGQPPQPSLRTRMVEWMRETYFHLKSMVLAQDVFWDNVQVAYCLASVVRASVAYCLAP
ncbi:hypothetical protein DUNSADRAFT_8676 [Dunaliella salina]|uniref:Uncharacterized protein n=1 Tax=Dunaliella salina TaxID=3046 RepID=A0ABQ7GJ22_DUNSA|nr:hypothetical protein DUNSADRAFT_8676 [Dunaliella salina]|eukprot:KAF5834593.1 hypothetical protein DUNSADRAFT_8676 [Dunaliella salina]